MTPTLVLVHGAWHGSWCWEPLVDALGDVPVQTIDLPSVGEGQATLGDLYADAAALRSALSGIDGPTVVLGHSYGGAVITEAVTAGSGVAHLVYLCAFLLDEGESLLGAVGGTPPPWWDVRGDRVLVQTPAEVFYNDVSPELTARSVARVSAHSLAAFDQPLTNAGWKSVPSTYVISEQDQAIPVFAQEAMAQRAGEVLRMDTGHSPFLSQPGELAGLLRPILDRAG
ncbi:alpha/beta fold hydrolase [Modestobacter excelsi]|uniref:alpha/beta fold hydrolase n=1 Tax=Modestobacter excelsi TaxID=2213161 RepID=UPI00110D2014|nr:alpha/beta hydrolase [Modestobacter excelsi]